MPRTAFILILMDDQDRAERLHELLRRETGHSCRAVATLSDALDSIRQKAPDIVVAESVVGSEATAPPLAGLLDTAAPDATLIVVGDSPVSARARHIQVILMPAKDDPADLVAPINRAATSAAGRRDDRLLRKSIDEHRGEAFEGIVGTSPGIRNIIERIRKAARNKLTVLILGETGTGKDLIAEAIHKRSDRARKPLLPLNCAGLGESLLESHLFGHVKGAFTGAVADRKGYFEAADGGTLFLDEIGDMPLSMQAKLLRTLERREITPVGSTEIRRVDVRLIAATNVALSKKVEDKSFREDLYYRLNQWVIRVPPLRERREDIPGLALHLLERARVEHGFKCPGFSSEVIELLTKNPWPGNVRELANVIVEAAVEAEGRQIEPHDLPERIRGTRDIVPLSGGLIGLTMAEVERMMIEKTLQITGGNREQAAKRLGIGTRTLYRKLKDYGMT